MLDLKALALPFPVTQISWRVGSTTADKSKGMALAYIDARDVMERLDDVCGADGWQDTYPHAGQKTVCSIGIRVGDEWIWKSNGAGDTDHEAEKGALSDAFKRAAVMWGVGRYLYSLPSPWVAIKQRGKSYVIDDAEQPRLRDLLQKFSDGLAVPPSPSLQPSSPNGRRLAAQEPQLIDHDRKKGTLNPPATGNTKAEERAAKVKAATDKRISALKSVTGWTRPTLDQFWEDNKTWIDWMADPANGFLQEYERFSNAFADAEVNMMEAA